MSTNVELAVYIERGCGSCRRALAIAREVDDMYPSMSVRVIDVADADAAGRVFAVPTFVLNGEIVSLGNPDRSDLRRRIESLLAQR